MKISTTSVKGVKDHTYTVDAYKNGYGQGAVRKVSVSALDTHVTNSGTTTYIDPTGLDKVGGSYTWTNKKDDLSIGGDGYATASGYNSPSHKVAFDVITGNDTTITEAARPGVEAGYNGESWSCIDNPDTLPEFGSTNGLRVVVDAIKASDSTYTGTNKITIYNLITGEVSTEVSNAQLGTYYQFKFKKPDGVSTMAPKITTTGSSGCRIVPLTGNAVYMPSSYFTTISPADTDGCTLLATIPASAMVGRVYFEFTCNI